MSYIGSQLERIGLVVDDRKGTVLNPSIHRVSVKFFSGRDPLETNNISIDDGTLNRIFRVLQDEENFIRSNSKKRLRRNAERHPYWDSHELMRLYEILRKTSPRSPYFKSTMGYVWRQLRVKPYQFRTKAKLLNEVRRRFIASQGYVR